VARRHMVEIAGERRRRRASGQQCGKKRSSGA
jgi:hypothetical protein